MSNTSRKPEQELTAIALARAAGVRIDGLYVTLRSGKIPAHKGSDGKWRIAAKDFEEYMAKRKRRITQPKT
jgi:predicted site-specific integrase-resolvase